MIERVILVTGLGRDKAADVLRAAQVLASCGGVGIVEAVDALANVLRVYDENTVKELDEYVRKTHSGGDKLRSSGVLGLHSRAACREVRHKRRAGCRPCTKG